MIVRKEQVNKFNPYSITLSIDSESDEKIFIRALKKMVEVADELLRDIEEDSNITHIELSDVNNGEFTRFVGTLKKPFSEEMYSEDI